MLPKLHRNSQKRTHSPGRIYYTVTKTKNNFLYFKEKIFCELLIEELKLAKKLKDFKLLAFSVIYDHLNLMVQTTGECNISEIMKSIKKQFSHDVNRVMGLNEMYPQKRDDDLVNSFEGDETLRRLQRNSRGLIQAHQERVKYWHRVFIHKYRNFNMNNLPNFKWQKSFHDHIIRDRKDYYAHYNYTIYNHLKHGLPKNWRYKSLNYLEDKEFVDVVWW